MRVNIVLEVVLDKMAQIWHPIVPLGAKSAPSCPARLLQLILVFSSPMLPFLRSYHMHNSADIKLHSANLLP
jgi:hypothetical protein